MRHADARLNASIISSNSNKWLSTGFEHGCTTNTSAPRTFSSIWK